MSAGSSFWGLRETTTGVTRSNRLEDIKCWACNEITVEVAQTGKD
jgi:hypothetical protein